MYADELAFAHLLADAAAPIAMELFADEGLEIRHKADRTLVTAADLEIERMVRDRLATAFPEDRIMGEEDGSGSSIRSTARRTSLGRSRCGRR
jgi:histidinol-phosphatase